MRVDDEIEFNKMRLVHIYLQRIVASEYYFVRELKAWKVDA